MIFSLVQIRAVRVLFGNTLFLKKIFSFITFKNLCFKPKTMTLQLYECSEYSPWSPSLTKYLHIRRESLLKLHIFFLLPVLLGFYCIIFLSYLMCLTCSWITLIFIKRNHKKEKHHSSSFAVEYFCCINHPLLYISSP